MKIGLFLALLVALASTNVYGQKGGRKDHSSQPMTNGNSMGQDNGVRPGSESDKPLIDLQPEVSVRIGRELTETVTNNSKPVEVIRDENVTAPTDRDEHKHVVVTNEVIIPVTVAVETNKSVEIELDQQSSSHPSVISDTKEEKRALNDGDQVNSNDQAINSQRQRQRNGQRSQVNQKPSDQVSDRDDEETEGERQRQRNGQRSQVNQKPLNQVSDRDNEETEGERQRQRNGQRSQVNQKPSNQVSDRDNEETEGERQRQRNGQRSQVNQKPSDQVSDRDDEETEGERQRQRNGQRSQVNQKPSDQVSDRDDEEIERERQRNAQRSRVTPRPTDDELELQDDDTKPDVIVSSPQTDRVSDNRVHVSGNIILTKYHSSVIDAAQYDLEGSPVNGVPSSIPSQSSFAENFLDRQSRVILYVSTSKTLDRKLAFTQFPIQYKRDHFPLAFDIDVILPNQQRGLLDRADITLYFFVYITHLESRIDTFLPAGTSQILLQGTNRLVQKLDIYVKASGVEVNGLFRGRFGQRNIRPGTSFEVLVVPEQSLVRRENNEFESVAQLTLNNVPAMFPVPFSLLVHYQTLKPNTKYFAIAYIFENGVRRLLHQEPVFVINAQKLLVTPQVIFTVVPSPFILRGTVARSMPGPFAVQPGSSLILRLHEIGSDSRDIIFKLPDLLTLPQVFQVNISQAHQFDPSKNYDMRALITDAKNNIYMASLQPIPLLDEVSRFIVPVDDLLYYIQARLQSSSNQPLEFIPGSTAQVFITESPETPTKPIVALRMDSLPRDFRDFSLQVPATAIRRDRNYYLVFMVEISGVITHVSKSLLISNNQPPPLVVQLPVLSLNLISGVIFDVDNRPAQWSSSAFANLYLIDDRAEDPDRAIVQVWKIHLENDFPVRFEVHLDFSRLRPDHVYRLQGAIENAGNIIEYKPAGSVLALNPKGGIVSDVRIPVHNVKQFQLVRGLVYMNDVRVPLPEKSEVIVQLSSSSSLTNPTIIDEIHLRVDGHILPVNFTMNLPLNKIDINSVYYFIVRYGVRDNIVIPATQAFAFSPRNEATVVLTLSKTPQIPITGQVTSTGSPLILPSGSTLHLYVTDNSDQEQPVIFSEVSLQASPNSLYEFTMNIDSVVLQKKIPLYLRADILYDDRIILSIPRPALLQITPGGEWNINLVVDLPTLLIGEIVSMSPQERMSGDLDVSVQIVERGTKHVVHALHLRLSANLPQRFRVELDNDLFARYPSLQARAVIKNCKGQVLFESGGVVDIHPGLNIKVILPVVLTDRKRLSELQGALNEVASIHTGIWRLSVTGVVTDVQNGAVHGLNNKFALQN